ncbi:uncharacterized protein [Ptychodera flava]|uniref:uncharacterized protein n=1 Tax=Ptychodera flava TaxID=63121 RepID=UPI003969EE7D
MCIEVEVVGKLKPYKLPATTFLPKKSAPNKTFKSNKEVVDFYKQHRRSNAHNLDYSDSREEITDNDTDAYLSLFSTDSESDVSNENGGHSFQPNLHSSSGHETPSSSRSAATEESTTNQMKWPSPSVFPANYIGLLKIHQSQLFHPPENIMARRIDEQFMKMLKLDIVDNFELWQQSPLSGVIDTNQCKDSRQYSAKRLPKYKIYIIDGNDTLGAYREIYRETGDKRFETLKVHLYAGLTDVECLTLGITEPLSPKTQGPTDLEKICFCRKLLYAMNGVSEDQPTPAPNKMWTDRVHRTFNLTTKSQHDGMSTIKKIAKFDKEQWDLLYKFYVQNPTFKARRFDVLNGVDQATKFQLIRELGEGEITFPELRERARYSKLKDTADTGILTVDATNNLNLTCQSLVNVPLRAIRVKHGRTIDEEITGDELIKAIKELKRQRALTNSSDDVAGNYPFTISLLAHIWRRRNSDQ